MTVEIIKTDPDRVLHVAELVAGNLYRDHAGDVYLAIETEPVEAVPLLVWIGTPLGWKFPTLWGPANEAGIKLRRVHDRKITIT